MVSLESSISEETLGFPSQLIPRAIYRIARDPQGFRGNLIHGYSRAKVGG